jgi:hypothetical protein
MALYNRVIRKIVVGFGNLFDSIKLYRFDSNNNTTEHVIVPIVYATKERYVMRLQDDPNLDKKTQLTLPRMSFEMTGLEYDPSRKQNTNLKNFNETDAGIIQQYLPVPYNFDFNLYIYVRNIEDGTQIIEHILPFFTPDYTIKLNLVPEMGIVKEIPVILNSTTHDIIYEGPRENQTRMVIWTLNFTVKGFVFGKSSDVNVIKHSIVSIFNRFTSDQTVQFTMDTNDGYGVYQIGENVYQGVSVNSPSATGQVVNWANDKLSLTDINGDFISTMPIYGSITGANYKFLSYDLVPRKLVQIDTYGDVTVDIDYISVDNLGISGDNTEKPITTVNESKIND